MATNLMQIRRLVRSRLGIPLMDDFITDQVVDDHINLALQAIDAEARWPWTAGLQHAPLTATDADFTPLADWRASRAVFYREHELSLIAPGDLFRFGTSSSDVPEVWCPMGDVVSVRPLPNGPITVEHYYYRQSAWLMGDADVPTVPGEYTGAIVAKAAELLATRESAGGDQTRHHAEYVDWIARMRKDMRRSTSPSRIRVRPGSWV